MESNQSSSKLKSAGKSNSVSVENSNSVNCSKEKRMKKDDSGIHVDKDESSSSEDEVNTITPNSTARLLTSDSRTHKSNPNSPDSGNQENGSLSDELQPAVLDNTKKQCDKPSEVSGEENKDPSDKYDCDWESEVSGDENKDDSDKYDPTPKTERPVHKWSAPLSMLKRQYGCSARYSPDHFRYKCYGSLHMTERLELMYKMKGHEGCVNTLNFNASGTKLASGSDDLDIIVWDWTISEILLQFNTGHRSNVFQAKFIPLCGDSQIVSCARDGQVRIAELSVTGTCTQTRKLAQHKGAAHKLAIQFDSPHTFRSCGEDAAVFEIDLRENKPEKLVICKENLKKIPLYSIYTNPMKPYEYVVGGRHHYVRVYDNRFCPPDDRFLKQYCPEHLISGDGKANVTSVVYNYNGSEILASYNDDDIYLFDANSTDVSTYLHRYAGHRNSQTVKGVNFFGAQSEYILSGSDCGYIFFWDKESEHIVKYMHGDEAGVVNCLEPNPNMPVLATSGLDDDIKIWVPSCEEPPDLSRLHRHVMSNMIEREEERRNEADAFDDQVLWFLMQHLRRSRRLSQSQSAGANESTSNSSSEDSELEEFNRRLHPIQCSPS